MSSSSGAQDFAEVQISWVPLDSAQALQMGQHVRYRLRLTDAWQGRQRRSTLREAVVSHIVVQKERYGGGERRETTVVLRHQEDGALDCVEASRLLDLHVVKGTIL